MSWKGMNKGGLRQCWMLSECDKGNRRIGEKWRREIVVEMRKMRERGKAEAKEEET